MKYDHLLGRKFVHGRHDCYALMQNFYADNSPIRMRNYARPDMWWDHDENLYMDNFRAEGFTVFNGPPQEWLPGDLILMAIRSRVANHSGILIENGRILHHLWGRLSVVEPYRGLTRNSTVAILRHPDFKVETTLTEIEVLNVMPAAFRRKYAAILLQRGEGAGRPDPEGQLDS